MKKILLSLFFAISAIAAHAQEPAVTLTTSKEVGESFSFYIATKVDSTTIQVDWGNGIPSNFTVGQSSTLIYGDLTGNTIKVYGEGITELSVLSQYLNNLDVSNASTLEILSCSSNNLTTLNLSSNTNLKELYCGSNKLNLLNVTANISLTALECNSNTLTSLDLSFNTALKNINCSYNQISTLNLTNNNVLTSVYCAGNQLTLLTLPSSNTLSKVICFNNKLTSLDISGNPNITILDCGNNQISTLELTNHTYLQNIYCNNNLLTTINLLNKPDLYKVDCSNNRFNLSTLPLSQINWITYNYSPQAKFQLPKNTYSTGEDVDLSSQLAVNGVNTVYTWKTTGGQTLTSGTDYTENNGIFTFNVGQADSLYCEMTNTNFPDLTLITTSIAVPLPAPAIIMTTTTPIGSTFSFEIAANADNTPIQVDWGDGTLASYTIGTNYSTVSGTLTGSTIKIYGVGINYLNLDDKKLTSLDVTNNTALTYLYCYSNQLTTLDVTRNTALKYLYCDNNQLTTLDVSKNTELTGLYCYSNQLTSLDVTNNAALTELNCYFNQLTSLDITNNAALTELICPENKLTALDVTNNTALTTLYCYSNQLTSLDVSKNTALTTLSCSDNHLTTLDVTKNTALTYLNCQYNKLTTLDVTKNTALTVLGSGNNQLTTLDVSKNTALTYLDCYFNQLTTLDVSQNTSLTQLYCYNNQLTSLDVTQNTAFTELHCHNNQLTSLDVSQNTDLTQLYCHNNQLTTLDVSQNTAFTYLSCYNNQLRFNTLPLRQPTWTDYYYSPQAKLSLPKTKYELNEVIDLSSQLTAGGNTTVYTWKTAGGITLVKDVDYTESNGKFAFLKTYTDSVYCEMTNASFPDLTLSSTSIKVYIPEPNITMSTTKSTGSVFSFNIMASINNTPITIDWGDGTMVSDTVGTVSAPIEGNLLGNTVKIWGKNITYLNVMNNKLTDLDVSNCLSLLDLNCKYNQLSTIDLTGNTELLRFDCLGNNLNAIDLSQNSKLEYLSCGDNNINALNISNNTKLTQLYCFNNNISSIDITNNTLLKELDLSDNQVKLLDISNNNALERVKCYNNWFTFSSLPIKQASWLTYLYSPQYNYLLDKVYSPNEEINLSEQLSINGNTTQYVWKTRTGQTLTSGTDYTENSGRFTFPTALSDSIYCEMTNATFPDLTLTTTFTAIQPVPSITITTAMEVGSQFMFGMEGVADNTPIQIDWGDGVLESYTINSYYTGFSYPLKGSEIRIWGTGVQLLDVTNREVTRLNVSKAKTLRSLRCSDNMLDTLDLSGCSVLFYVECTGNAMTSLTLPSTSTLKYVTCENNSLTFATLPTRQPSWTSYTYSPQAKLPLPKKTYEVNEAIDLSNQLTVGNSNTVYTWKTTGGVTLIKGVDYTVSSGVFRFINTFMDSLYCEMTNTSLPDLTLVTENIAVPMKPAIIMTTTTPVGSTFSFEIAANADNTPIQVDWGSGTLASYTIGTNYSTVSGTLNGSAIKIYGVGINYLNLYNKELTSLDVTNNTALTKLYCSLNQLTSLDVSKNTALKELYCYNNQLTTLDVSKNTALTYLDCGFNQLTTLDMSKNTALKYLYCYSNQITSLDVSKNTALTYLDCCFNQLTSLDVSQNTSLAILYCYNNQLTTLDVSQNTYLAILYCDNNQLTTLDVSQNTSLEQLYCYNNQLTTLDVSKNTALEYLYCNSNKLTTLDVSQNTALTQLYCYNNQLRFSTLPLRQPSWTDYYYSPQAKLSLPKTEYELNEEIDLSSQLTAGGNTTVYTWKTAGGITLVKDVDYTESNGKFTFLKQSGDYFYCEMTNATFPDLTLTTENISIPQTEPAITMTTTTPAGSTFSFEIAATADNSPIQVDWGSGTLASYTIGTNNSTVSGTLTGSDIKIYGVGINYLDLYDKKLTSLDVTNNTALTKLSCGDNQLTTLNVTNNTVLINLACSNNQLTSLDVTQNAALIDLYCGYNQLTTLDVTSNTALTTLSCSDNQLSSLDVSQNAALTYFYCYNNQLTSLDVSKNTALTDLNCESNQLTSLDVTNDTALTYLDCSSNQLITLDVTSNTALTHLSCDYNKLTTLDVSKNTALTDLDCAYNQLTTLDVTQNTALSYLYCYNNQLTTLDVTQNAALTHLGCSSNQLTTLDVSNNTALTSLYCYNNQLRFSTLPLRQPSWLNYSYSPQAKVELAKKQYGLTETVDLSSELTVDGKTTSYIWKTKGGATLVAGTDYNVTGGVTTFLKVQSDSVYCQMTNATFPELTLTTTNIKVSQFPLSVGNNEVAVKIYPNPATDNFSIEMAEEIVKVEVYTLTGVKVFENGLYNSTRVTVPTGSMPKGALVVRTYTRNGVYESKVIKI